MFTQEVLVLYQRCRRRQQLPVSGGVMDQPEELMAYFDAIDAAVSEFEQQQQEDARRNAEFDRLRRELRGRNG